ncbi:hypothetical protein HK101_009428, partial [Irineochytrium annulatum]
GPPPQPEDTGGAMPLQPLLTSSGHVVLMTGNGLMVPTDPYLYGGGYAPAPYVPPMYIPPPISHHMHPHHQQPHPHHGMMGMGPDQGMPGTTYYPAYYPPPPPVAAAAGGSGHTYHESIGEGGDGEGNGEGYEETVEVMPPVSRVLEIKHPETRKKVSVGMFSSDVTVGNEVAGEEMDGDGAEGVGNGMDGQVLGEAVEC